GRNGTKSYKHQQTNDPNGGLLRYHGAYGDLRGAAVYRYAETTAESTESHEIFDFMIGKDVGIGMNGTLSGGMRFVHFRTQSHLAVYSDPDYVNPNTKYTGITGPKYFHNYNAIAKNKTSFNGMGPRISWDASAPISGDTA